MSTADLAGILGLVLGGAGGYYGGQRRAARADEEWDKYADLQREGPIGSRFLRRGNEQPSSPIYTRNLSPPKNYFSSPANFKFLSS